MSKKKEELLCSICGCEIDLEGEGGTSGYFGVCPVAFCVWCYSSICDMMDKVKCNQCSLMKRAIKKKKRSLT